MSFPIKPLDLELTDPQSVNVPVADGYRQARVLVRWHRRPIAIVDVSVCQGHVRRTDVVQQLISRHATMIGREAIRRALLTTGIPDALQFATLPDPTPTIDQPPLPSVSVVICTRDRTEDLAACLQSIRHLRPAPLEVIVVDNAPATDGTARLLADQYPEFRYVREDRPGLDHARNRGIAEARGDVVAFTDDDVVVDPEWAEAMARPFATEPDLGLVSGLVEPLELETEAQQLFERYGGFGRGCFRHYLQAPRGRPLHWSMVGAGQLGAGASMAIRRAIFDEIGAFDPALDVGTPTRGGGDHEMFFRILRAGYLCIYEPAAVVRHRHRRTRRELEKLLYDYGHATRCFFERAALNFPQDASAVKQLQRWWWQEWAWRRWRRSWGRPAVLPSDLVTTEVRGFMHGRGAYSRARSQIVSNEYQRPDSFRAANQAKPVRPGVGIFLVDVAQPLGALEATRDYNHVELVVHRAGRPIGSLRVSTWGQPLSAARLADEIAQRLWTKLVRPGTRDDSAVWGYVQAQLITWLQPTPPVLPAPPREWSATVIVTTCNRPDDLRRCLTSLVALQSPRQVQLIVVDNRPATKLAAPVVQEFPGVELIEEWRPGSSYARNAGVAAARGDFIAMTDDDMVVTPDWLERLLAPFARADVMAVTGNTLPARLETEAERWFETYGGFARGYLAQDFDRRWFHSFRRRAVPTWKIGGSGNAAYRTEIFSHPEIGGFDETLGAGVPTGVGEDTRLFYDVLKAGFTIAYEPAAVAWHHHRVTMRALQKQIYAYSKGHVAYHLVTLLEHSDGRGLYRVVCELPLGLFRRMLARLRGRSQYPWRLLLIELAGNLAGPWSLYAARRNARRLGRGPRRSPPSAPQPMPLSSAWEAS